VNKLCKRSVGILFLIDLMVLSAIPASAQDCVELNGKAYVKADADNADRDTGDEVCALYGAYCVGASERTDSVCKLFHPDANSSTSGSGDYSGVYCDGPPQIGVCSTLSDSCHTCPFCTASVACSTPISSLYREMFFECDISTCAPPDSDGDGIPDASDACPDSDLRPTIIIGEDADTGVVNELLNDGCTMSDLIVQALEDSGDVAASADVVGLLLGMRELQLISGSELGALLRGINQP